MKVVAALIFQANLLLACQRKGTGPFPGKWEFPGGKVEKGESLLTALRRELREELGIEIQSATEYFRHHHAYPDQAEVELIFFWVNAYGGSIKNLAFQQLSWVEIPQLKRLDFLEGDLPLVKKLMSDLGPRV